MERCCGNESFTIMISLLLMNREETLRAVYLNLKILFETDDGSLGLSSDSIVIRLLVKSVSSTL